MVSLIQHFEADYLWKVSLKILNSGIILKTFTHVYYISSGSALFAKIKKNSDNIIITIQRLLFVLWFNICVNSYGHVETVS